MSARRPAARTVSAAHEAPKSHFLIRGDHVVTFTAVPPEQAEDQDGPVIAVHCSTEGVEQVLLIELARAYYAHLRSRGYLTAREYAAARAS